MNSDRYQSLKGHLGRTLDFICYSLRVTEWFQREETQQFMLKKNFLATDCSESRETCDDDTEEVQVRDDGSLDEGGSSEDDEIF